MSLKCLIFILFISNCLWLLTQADNAEFEYNNEEGEEEESSEIHSRDKRAIYVNNKVPVQLSLYVVIPISVAFRSVLEGRSLKFSGSDEATEMIGSYDQQVYRKNLKKIDKYFTYLEVEEDSCRQKILCEMAADTDRYGPIYEVFEKQLRSENGAVKEEYKNRFFRFLMANDQGAKYGPNRCSEVYGTSCPYEAKQVFNAVLLRLLSLTHRYLKLELKDDE